MNFKHGRYTGEKARRKNAPRVPRTGATQLVREWIKGRTFCAADVGAAFPQFDSTQIADALTKAVERGLCRVFRTEHPKHGGRFFCPVADSSVLHSRFAGPRVAFRSTPEQRACVARWHAKNPEKVKAIKKKWAQSPKGKQWLKANQKKINDRRKAWRESKKNDLERSQAPRSPTV